MAFPGSKADLVSIEQGTDSTVSFSNGNTLPLVARPFGHAHFAPETAGTDADRWYHPRAKNFVGYRLTHQPSPWIGDYGWLRIGVDAPVTDQPPVGGPLRGAPLIRDASQGWHLAPYACAIPQQRAAGTVLAELAPTERCAILRLTIPAGAAIGRLLVEFPAANGRSSVSIELEQRRMVGKTAHHNGGADASFGCYFSVSIDEVPGAGALGGCGVWADDEAAHGCRRYPPTAVAQASPAKSQPALPHGSEANGDELWIGRTTHAGVVHAGKTRPGFGGVNFSHGGKPQCAKSGYDVLRVAGGAYRWVAAQGGNVPDGAVSAGGDVYVARAAVGGGVHPGEALPGVGCVVEYGGGGVTLDSYEVLVLAEGVRAEWVACTAGSLPEVADEAAAAGPAAGSPPQPVQPALPHGSEANGDELWIGRTTHAGVVHAGKTRPGFGGVNFSHGGKPQCAKSGYDVLRVAGGAYRWVAAQGGNVPDGAVSAGGDVYVARAAVGGGVHPGEALPGVGCVVEYGGGGVTLDSYEVLVLAEGVRAEWVACTAGSLPEVADEAAAAGPAAGSPPLFSKRRPTFAGGYLDVSTSGGTGEPTILLVRLGSSFISVAQAQLNAQRELGGRGFDEVAAEGKAEWDSTRALGSIEIGPAATTNVALAAAQRRTFYSCLYRFDRSITRLCPCLSNDLSAAGPCSSPACSTSSTSTATRCTGRPTPTRSRAAFSTLTTAFGTPTAPATRS